MRLLIASLALSVVASSASAQNVRVRIAIAGHRGPVAVDSLASTTTIDSPRGVVFHAVSQVFAEFKVPVDSRDSVRGLVGVSSMPKMRSFANKPISKWLNCGMGITGSNADNWRVYMTIFAFTDAQDSTHTTLRLAMIGGAQDVAGNSTEPVACGSTGNFESLVNERVKLRIAQGMP